MVALGMSARRCFLLAVMYVGLWGHDAYADGGHAIASGTVYQRSSRWVIVTDGKGEMCSLSIAYNNDENIQVLMKNKSDILRINFFFLKRNLNISMSGHYLLKLEFDGRLAFSRAVKPFEIGEASGVIVDDFSSDLVSEISKNGTLNLKIGEVSYGNYDLTLLKGGIPRLYDCMVDTTKWDITSPLKLRTQLSP